MARKLSLGLVGMLIATALAFGVPKIAHAGCIWVDYHQTNNSTPYEGGYITEALSAEVAQYCAPYDYEVRNITLDYHSSNGALFDNSTSLDSVYQYNADDTTCGGYGGTLTAHPNPTGNSANAAYVWPGPYPLNVDLIGDECGLQIDSNGTYAESVNQTRINLPELYVGPGW